MKYLILAIVTATILASCSNPTTYDVIDKFEQDGKCYVVVPIEVTPEEYIGIDVGDEVGK